MNSNYIFPFYKYKLISDIDLKYEKSNRNNETILLYSEKGNYVVNEKIEVDKDSKFIIESPIASYVLMPNSHQIQVKYNSIEDIRSTIFNLPAAVWAACKNEVLLHSSSICVNNNVIAFCAPKGTGKTTLVSMLGKCLPVFSDDTIYLSNEKNKISCYSHLKSLKFTKKTFTFFCDANEAIFNSTPKTVQNKAYVSLERLGLKYFKETRTITPTLKSIFLLHRENSNGFVIKSINSPIEKTSILLENCVGLEYFPSEMIKNILKSKTFALLLNDIAFFNLYIPSSFSFLANNYEKIANAVMEAHQ